MAFSVPGKPKIGGLASLGRRDMDDEIAPPIAVPQQPTSAGLDKLEGSIERVIFAAEDGQFAIYLATTKHDGHSEEVSLLVSGGVKFRERDAFVAEGSWSTYKGKPQFKAVTARQPEVKGSEGIVAWLSQGVVPGVGEMTARKLLSFFGDDLEAAMGDAEELERAGILQSRAEAIANRWNENSSTAKLFSFLASVGLGEALSARVIKQLGMSAESVIRANPWYLAEVIKGIAFGTADHVARNLGCSMDSPHRIVAGLRHSLRDISYSRGHCAIKEFVLVKETSKLLSLSADVVKSGLDQLYQQEHAVLDEGLVYLPELHRAETRFAASIVARLGRRPGDESSSDASENCGPFTEAVAISLVDEEAAKLPFPLDESQRAACILALTNAVSIITGGPGTGKSTIQKLLVAVNERVGIRTRGAAPTGRAAKRQAEASSIESSTMHRLVGRKPSGSGPMHDHENPVNVSWLYIDEESMVEIMLADMVEDALPPHACVTFVGDVDQLTSVGPGQVLHDMIESGVIPVARLTQPHRQLNGDGGGIIVAASRVNAGELPLADDEELKGFYMIDESDEEKIIKHVERLLLHELPAAGYDLLTDVQVLVSMRKGECGTLNLNQRLREIFNPETANKRVTIGKHVFAAGDRVMHLQNDYRKTVFNGEIGIVDQFRQVPTTGGKSETVMSVDYSDWGVDYTRSDLSDIELSFAGTVHKAQGCEFKVVIFVAPPGHAHMLVREQVYTGISRAKSACYVIGDTHTLARGIKVKINGTRTTGLIRRLRGPDHELERKAEAKRLPPPSFGQFKAF